MVLKLLADTWFREVYRGSDKEYLIEETKSQQQIIKSIRFLDDKNIELLIKEVVAGRHSTCNIVLDSNKVSRKHCKFEKHMPGDWFVTDLNSSEGTAIKRGDETIIIESKFKLETNDIIIVGSPDTQLWVIKC